MKDKNKEKSQESKSKKKHKIVQSTQKQIPIKDLANGSIITTDNKIVKMIEVFPIPFSNMKVSQQNIIRGQFENLFKTAPDSFQIFSLSIPANLQKQINTLDKKLEKETNKECLKLANDYKKNLESAEKYGINRRFFIAFTNDADATRTLNSEDVEKQMYRLNQMANRLITSVEMCGNKAKLLNNNEIASVLYFMLNRSRKEKFEERYELVYNRYLNEYKTKDFYIPPTDYIAPNKINFMDNNCVMIDNRYYTYLYIRSDGYPEQVVCGWLDTFVSSFEGVDVHIFFKRKDSRKFKETLRKTIGHSKMDIGTNTNDVSDSYFNATSKYYAAQYLYTALQSGQDIFDASVVISISGESLTEINEKRLTIIDDARSQDIELRDLRYQMEKAFASTLPLNSLHQSIAKKAKRNMPQSTCATLYPFTTFEIMQDEGVYIANSRSSNSPVIPNFWDNTVYVNPHLFIAGTSGAGKSASGMLFLIHLRLNNIPVYVIAPEKQQEFMRLCDAIGGQFVTIGLGSKDRINIMEIFESDKSAEESDELINGRRKTSSYLSQRAGVLIEFIHIHYKEMTMYEKQLLNDAIIQTYRKKGITEDNESLWADEEKTHYKKMPILSDLVETLQEMGPKAENLYMAVKYLTTGACDFFNGQTNVDVNNRFFVIGLEDNTDETKALAAYLAEDFIQLKIRENRLEHSAFYIDEAWSMLENPVSAGKLKEDAKILRAFGALLCVATQQLSDSLSTEEGATIVKNCATKILMKHNDEDIKYLLNADIELSSNEIKDLKSFSAGEALFLSGQNRLSIKFAPSELEKLLIFNDEKTLRRYKEYAMAKIDEDKNMKEYNEKLESAISLDEIMKDPRKEYANVLNDEESIKEMIESEENEDE